MHSVYDFDDDWGDEDTLPIATMEPEPEPMMSYSEPQQSLFSEQKAPEPEPEPRQVEVQAPQQTFESFHDGFNDSWSGPQDFQTHTAPTQPYRETREPEPPAPVSQHIPEPEPVVEEPELVQAEPEPEPVVQQNQWTQQVQKPAYNEYPHKRKPPMKMKPVAQAPVMEVKSADVVDELVHSESTQSEIVKLRQVIEDLRAQVALLQKDQYIVSTAICTLNSAGSLDNKNRIKWTGSRHVLPPPPESFELSEDSATLVLKRAGYYEVNVNTFATDVKLMIDEGEFATSHTDYNSSHFSINLYLRENTKIEVLCTKINTGIASDHWLSVRRLPSPIS